MTSARRAWPMALVLITALLVFSGCRESDDQLTEWQRVKSGGVEVVLLSPHGAPRHGRDRLIIEFRSAVDGRLVDVGDVRASATMPMTGMPMVGSIDVARTSTAGRYAVSSQLEMAGTWRIEIRWQQASENASASFAGTVQ
jgi:YtkA-like protein